MNKVTKLGFLKRPVMTGAAAIALGFAAFGAGQVLQPHDIAAQAIRARPPAAAAALPSFADLVERVAPAVVAIEVVQRRSTEAPSAADLEQIPPEFRRFFEGRQGGSRPREVRGGGSGFFITPNGHIVTNYHVVDEATSIKVTMKDGRELNATVVGRDERTDLAVLKVEGNNYPHVQFEPNTNLRVGDWVVAIGNPFGLGGSASAGIVSGLGRENVGSQNIADFIQIDAPINPGNSGGPTFDMAGRVIGVNTSIISQSGGNIGIGFAIPASIAQNVTQQIIRAGHVTYGWLGVGIQDLTPEMAESFGLGATKGAIVGSVTPGAPAANAGIHRGDVILSFNGQAIEGASDLTRRVGQTIAGQTVRLEVANPEGRKRMVNVVIATRPSEKQLADNANGDEPKPDSPAAVAETTLGLTLAPLTAQARARLRLGPNDGGLMVTAVDDDSAAAERGIKVGDAILEVNGTSLTSTAQFRAAVDAAKAAHRTSIGIYVTRAQGAGGYVPLPVE
ncbi:MAG: Do family serine endopeptidase [Pseudomonadota bacterium]